MAFTFFDLFSMARPLSKSQKANLSMIKDALDKEDLATLVKLIKTKKVMIDFYTLNIKGLRDNFYPKLILMTKEADVKKFCDGIKIIINNKNRIDQYKRFSKIASNVIPKFISPNIYNLNEIKQAVMLMIASKEPIHILLLGDPGTGKTEILRSAVDLSKIGQYGLGSGTSGVGLSVTYKGDEMIKGLLPLADGGVCAIDELNLMKDEDRASLYNAMEKGFIVYNKGRKHINIPANVKIIATANPKKDKFISDSPIAIKAQLPFESALLSRFHLVFIIRKHSINDFKEISKRIIENTSSKNNNEILGFIKDYLDYAADQNVELPKNVEKLIVDFIADIKEHEKNYIIDVTPRLVIGIVRLVKAKARIALRKQAEIDDFQFVRNIFETSLNLS